MNFFDNIIPPKEVDYENKAISSSEEYESCERKSKLPKKLYYFQKLKLNLGDDH